jgi:hypothetical protein
MDGLSGWCSRRVCVWLVWVEKPISCMVWCVGVAVLRGGVRWRNIAKRRCFRLLNLVLLVGKVMLSIANLMVDGGCIATTGGRRLAPPHHQPGVSSSASNFDAHRRPKDPRLTFGVGRIATAARRGGKPGES